MADLKCFRTRIGGSRRALVNMRPWSRKDFRYLGFIYYLDTGDIVPWAWHWDGTSIDRHDNSFDLMDFSAPDMVAGDVFNKSEAA